MKKIFQLLLAVCLAGSVFAQNPLQIQDCPGSAVTVCDVTSNLENLWNETYWHDPVNNNLQDLTEAPVDLTISVTDTCAITGIRYLLFLDLDQNGTQETVIDSDNPPGYNNVQFDNAFNPNYSGGTSSAFDERPVGTNEKYGFALQVTGSGNTQMAHLAWNTLSAPNTYAVPELPYGTHRIKWFVTDACGNESTCEYTFVVKDCKPPTVVCLNGLSVNIMQTQVIQLWDTDFLQYAEDNSTLSSLLEFGIRKSGTGTGFPFDGLGEPQHSVTFDCSELGINEIELWAIDLAGNADFCETYILVSDGQNFCPGQTQYLTTCIRFWRDGSPMLANIDYQGIDLSSSSSGIDANGCMLTTTNTTPTGNLTAVPSLDTDPMNGVNTLDLLRISRHILGYEPILSPYALVAADANRSGSITTFDIVTFRKLLLGAYATLPDNTSWRFVDASFQFPNTANPFQTAIPPTVTVVSPDSSAHFAFVGLKVGDVDGNAYPGFGAPAEDRSNVTVILPDVQLQAGETIDLPLHFSEPQTSTGLQMTWQFDPADLEVENVSAENLPDWDENAWAQPEPGLLRMIWFDAAPQVFPAEKSVMALRVRALRPLRLRESLHLADSGMPSAIVGADDQMHPLRLGFDAAAGQTTTISAPQPNPTLAGDVYLPVELKMEEKVRLLLTDLDGRILLQREELLAPGTYRLTLPATAFARPGMYGWRVETDSVVASGKIVKM